MTVPTRGQAATGLTALLSRNQFNLATDGLAFLQREAKRSSFFLVGGLHGDNETQTLVQSVMAGLGNGPRLVIMEMSPWAASRSFAGMPDSSGVRFRGVDIEEAQLPRLIRELGAANPANRALQEMVALTKDGYRRALAATLLGLADQIGDVKGESPGGGSAGYAAGPNAGGGGGSSETGDISSIRVAAP